MIEQERTERAAWEGEMFRLLAANVLDYAIFAVDPHRHVLSWSKGAERLLGFTEAEIVGKQCDCFFTPEDVRRGVPQRELDEALATGRGDDDRWHMRKDGTRFWASGVVTPLKDEGGTLRGFAKIMRDRTEMKRAADAAYERGRQRNLLTDHAPVMIAHIDADRRYKFVNKPFAAHFNLHPREVVGRLVRDVMGGPAYAAVEEHVDAALGGERVEFEAEVHHDGHGLLVMRCAYDPEFDAGGRVRGVVAAIVNATESRRAINALRLSEERLRLVVESATGFAIFTMDGGGVVTGWNSGAERLFGYRDAEIIGQHDRILYTPEDATGRTPEREIKRAAEEGRAVNERWHVRKDGSRFWGSGLVQPLRADGGSVVGFMKIMRDMTEARRWQETLERQAGELKEADRRKDEFLATLAHELRNPMAPLRNGLQVIRLAGANGQVEQARMMMERQLTQLVRLVDDLLDVSRITRGKLELRMERVELRAVIDAALETARPVIEHAGHELAVAVPDEPIFVDGDAARLAQVVANLLNNSAKYTHRGGHVRLTVGREGGMAVVTVADDGIGIPEGMLGKVFDLFTQVDRTLEKTTGGLGIGLSLVKGLVAGHGGTIEARSEGEGRGSEFVVRLPVVTSEAGGSDHPKGQAEEIVSPGRRRILVVDDNEDSADSLGQLLELLGNEVRTAHDGEAGVERAGAFRPDVVLMDIGMPKLNGYAAARRIRDQPWGRDVVLVALTGWGQEDDRQKSADAGFDFHLVKPVESAALMKILAASNARGSS